MNSLLLMFLWPSLVPRNVVKQRIAKASNITGATGSEVDLEGKNQDNLILACLLSALVRMHEILDTREHISASLACLPCNKL